MQSTALFSSIVLHGLRFGIENSAHRDLHAAQLDGFLSDGDDALVAGRIRADLARAGTPIGADDMLIAAQALRRG